MDSNIKAHHNATQKSWYFLRKGGANYTKAMWDNY